MSFLFKPATRQNSKVLIGLYGESGSGKTYSALLMGRGIAGKGRLGMIDTESGRGSIYADKIEGGYDVINFSAPFSPTRYIEAIEAAEQQGVDVLVIDSASHEWEGLGGVLEMAGENESRSGKAGLHNWKDPKMQHQRFMLKLLQTKMHIIVCVRGKHKSRQAKDNGKTVIVKDDHVSPIQADDFIFEMTAHMEIAQDTHGIHITKCSHPDLLKCFEEGKPITTDTGRRISEWSKSGSEPEQPPKPYGIRGKAGVVYFDDADEWLNEFKSRIDKIEKPEHFESFLNVNETFISATIEIAPDHAEDAKKYLDEKWSKSKKV